MPIVEIDMPNKNLKTYSKAGIYRRIFITLLLLCMGVTGWVTAEEVYAPYVTGLRIAVKDPQIKLSWNETAGLEATYHVYRHTEPINSENLNNAVLAGITETGEESFTDSPYRNGSYYYAVLAKDKEGRLYRIFIPFKNVSIKEVTVSSLPDVAGEPIEVAEISASAEEDGISISLVLSSSPLGREIAIIRSTDSLSGKASVSKEEVIAAITPAELPFKDRPIPGVPYYYGAVDAGTLAEGSAFLVPGKNAISSTVELPLGDKPTGISYLEQTTRRSRPLPYLSLVGDIETGEGLDTLMYMPFISESRELESDTIKALSRHITLNEEEKNPLLEKAFIPVKDKTGEGAESLQTITEGPISSSQWKESRNLLTNLLSIYLFPKVRSRAFFYRGQANYYLGNYRDAFMDMLIAHDEYPDIVQPWLDDMLERMSNN
jgi:hypothetical protein